MMHAATVGSISHGTMRTVDLLDSFAAELAYLNPELVLADEAIRLLAEYALADEAGIIPDELEESAADMVEHLFVELDELAPPYCYFGASEGDGSDYGFWPSMEAIAELPRVADPADVPEGGTGEDVAYANDHGNVTVYGADGTVLLELV